MEIEWKDAGSWLNPYRELIVDGVCRFRAVPMSWGSEVNLNKMKHFLQKRVDGKPDPGHEPFHWWESASAYGEEFFDSLADAKDAAEKLLREGMDEL